MNDIATVLAVSSLAPVLVINDIERVVSPTVPVVATVAPALANRGLTAGKLVPGKFRRGGFGFKSRTRLTDRGIIDAFSAFANEQVAKLKKIRKSNKRYDEIYQQLRNELMERLQGAFREQAKLNRVAAQKARRRAEVDIVPLFSKTVGQEYYPTFDAELSVELVNRIKNERIPAVRILVSADGVNVIDEQVSFSDYSSDGVWKDKIRPVVERYIDGLTTPFTQWYPDNEQFTLTIIPPTDIPARRLHQRFLDGAGVHCVMDDIITRCKKEVETAEGKTKLKWNRKLKLAEAFKRKYPKGMTEEEVDEMSKTIDVKIVIEDLVSDNKMIFNGGSGMGRPVFNYTNTRANHLESGTISRNATPVSLETLNELIDERRSTGETLITKKRQILENGVMKNRDTAIFLPGGTSYKLDDPFHQLFKDFREETGIAEKSYQGGRYPIIHDLVRYSINVNSVPLMISGGEAKHCYDMRNAYTKHKQCKYYAGFMGKIHTAGRVEDVDLNELGIVVVLVNRCSDKLLNALGIRSGCRYVITTPEARLMTDMGVDLVVQEGIFGKRFDFDYHKKEWLEPFGTKDDFYFKKKPYAHFAGMLGINNNTETYFAEPVNNEWYSHLSAISDNAEVYKFGDRLSITKFRNEFNSTGHIYTFILAYTRITMILQMREMKLENIVGVLLDGIFYKEDFSVGDLFQEKKADKMMWRDEPWYKAIDERSWFSDVIDKRLMGNCLLRGAGGTGKTYSIMTDTTKIDVLYVSPTKELRDDVKKKFSCGAITINRLLGEGCQPGTDYKSMFGEPPNMLIDELTMIPKKWIIRVLAMYPNSVILLAGDVRGKQHYQCRNGRPGAFEEIFYAEDWVYRDYLVDYRSQDEGLRKMKLRLREIMDICFPKYGGDVISARKVSELVRAEYPTVLVEDACKMFREGDYWIAGTHKTSKSLFERGIKSVLAEEGRGSITTHSSQGKTITDAKIFITVNDAFEYAQLYTAISRAVKLEQIVLVV